VEFNPAWISLRGERWLFDVNTWTLKDWFAIKAESGYDRIPFLNGLLSEDPHCLQTLVWYLQVKHTGQAPRRHTIDFAMNELQWEVAAQPDEVVDVPPSESADAKVPPRTSANGATTSSSSSPTTATSRRRKSTT
jgi:hypothetical protein